MNQNLTQLLFILDRSGSMQSMATAAIDGFNSFLRHHMQETGDARLTLVLFDDQFEVPCDNIPLSEVLPLDERTYEPRGCTALLDATARAIDELGAHLAALPEDDRPASVIVAILTDGFENASRRFTWQDVLDRIRHQRDVYQWDFLFLGANQDAIATAAQLGIQQGNAATFVADDEGAHASMQALSRKSMALRKIKAAMAMTAEEFADLEKPVQEILREEDDKRRRNS